MTKADLRARFLAERRALSPAEVERRSAAIANRFFLLPAPETTRTLHVFLPAEGRNEVNTWLIIRRIWADSPAVQVATSVTNWPGKTLTHYAFTLKNPLIANRCGIPEPVTSDQLSVASNQFDVVLVPLLAVDKRGHRVGYGGGYYDRFLAQCRPDCQKIGLSLFPPVSRIDDVEPTDVPLDECITPDCVWKF